MSPPTLSKIVRTAAAVVLITTGAQAQCVWGSFDSSRVDYTDGVLSTGAHVTLRSVITTNGGSIGLATGTLTSAYLATVDVFYTSLLHRTKGKLSRSEQSAMKSWFNAGGTLIVTGDTHSHDGYDSFTKWLGVTGWKSDQNSCRTTGPVVKLHPVTVDVSSIYYCSLGHFTHASTVTRLGNDAKGRPFLAVVNPTKTVKGRLLVLADHNLFTDFFINAGQNITLAKNIVRWTCSLACSTPAAWSNYGTGLAGQKGIPTLIPDALPVYNSTLRILGSNSSGKPSVGVLTVGLSAITAPLLGGSLLTSLDVVVSVTVPINGYVLPLSVPAALCGTPIHVQLLQADPAASQSVAFTPGLKLLVGH